MHDFCIVGGGIVGLATALAITRRLPNASVLVLEKESSLGSHQTGHNSGVIHAGVYYAPGSLKASLCRTGEQATKSFCDQYSIPYRTPGKLIVATNDKEEQRLSLLQSNAHANGIVNRRISSAELTELEPNIVGRGALLVESSGIVDFRKVARTIGQVISQAGGEIINNTRVLRVEELSDRVRVHTSDGHWDCAKAIVCAGLQADRMAARSGLSVDFQIIPFRGEYYSIRPEKSRLVTRMIYPVPDPDLPFLGVHLTPMMNGNLSVGPNAVLSMAREKYEKFSVDVKDVATYLRFPGFWRTIGSNLATGLGEMRDSLLKQGYLEKCRKYCPSLSADDLLPCAAGIRAQAVSKDGRMLHDFSVLRTKNVLHVCNAPSPAATSAIPIGEMLLDRLLGK